MTLLGEHGERAIQNVSPGHDETLGVEPEIADLVSPAVLLILLFLACQYGCKGGIEQRA